MVCYRLAYVLLKPLPGPLYGVPAPGALDHPVPDAVALLEPRLLNGHGALESPRKNTSI